MKFEDLHVLPGTALQLQISTESSTGAKCQSRVMGYVPGRSVLITVPVVGGKPVRLRPGQKVTVKTMVANGVGIFAATVQGIATSPYPYFHLSYPKSVSFKEIRGATRVDTRLPVRVKSLASLTEEAETEGIATDMSVSGARLELREAIAAVGDEVEIYGDVHIGPVRRTMKIQAIIRSRTERSTKEMVEDLPAVYGVQFLEEEEENILVLHSYVFSQMATSLEPEL
ncbi:MAG: flagellar brake protein [Cellvibrionaceae bacterium]